VQGALSAVCPVGAAEAKLSCDTHRCTRVEMSRIFARTALGSRSLLAAMVKIGLMQNCGALRARTMDAIVLRSTV